MLESNGVRCWISPRDIVPGTEFGASIISAIDTCGVMVVIFSERANQSVQVRREVERAVSKGLVIVPCRVEDVLPKGSLEYALSNTQWLDIYSPPLEEQLRRLAEVVTVLINQRLSSQTGETQPTMSPPASQTKMTISDAVGYEIDNGACHGNDIYCSELGEYLESLILTKVTLQFNYDLSREAGPDRMFGPSTEANFRFKLASTLKGHSWEDLQKLGLQPGVKRKAKFVAFEEDIRSVWINFTLMHCATAHLRVYDITWDLTGKPRV